MAFPPPDIYLPPSVEEMLQKICSEQYLSSPDHVARNTLSSLGEDRSLDLLKEISTSRIQNISALIVHVAKKVCSASNKGSACSPSRPIPASGTLRYEASSSKLSPKRPRKEMATPHLLALGSFEFRKMFLILCYLGKKKLEDELSIEMIRILKNLPMAAFESEVWKAIGSKCIPEEDRRRNLDWESNCTHLYRCHCDPDGNLTFKGPYLDKKRTHLQRVLGDENILDVRFANEAVDKKNSAPSLNRCNLAKEGIFVGLRLYRFFVFKDGGKELKKKNPTSSSVKCYFVCTESTAAIDDGKPYILFGKSIREARCVFMHVHTVANMAKYMARFSLILSKTFKLEIDLGSVNIEYIDDKPCLDEKGTIIFSDDGEPLIHTDGTGFISEDLAGKCPKNIYKGDYLIHGDVERTLDWAKLEKHSSLMQRKPLFGEPPLLIQCRLFNNGCAIKGTLLLNKLLPSNTIQVRRSMVKVEADQKLSNAPSINSLEIVATSNQPKKTSLSKNLIALLHYGGVPKEYFKDLLKKALDEAQNVHSSKRAAWKVAQKYGDMDDSLVLRMIACGIPLEEPFLKYRLSVLMREEHKSLKGGKLPVSECYYLMGTVDPTGTLNANEVCVILDNGQISGNVLIYRNPGIHFGDIHVVTATYLKDLESFVGNAKYAIFFPAKGPRSLAGEIANGDFDGDMYWVSRNPQLLDYFKPSKAWEQHSSTKKMVLPRPTEFSEDELENELFKQFLLNRFQSSNVVGTASDSWLALMNRLLTLGDECALEKQCLREKMLELIDIYYDALDAPKSGMKVEVPKKLKPDKFPHFMERENSYVSNSILGLIYDTVNIYTLEDQSPEEVCQLLPCFRQKAPDAYLMKWGHLYSEYRYEMRNALSIDNESKDTAAMKIYQHYKQILYGAAEFEESPRKREEIFDEALAIYQICYEYAKKYGTGKCCFAWKVAGRALCSLYSIMQNEVLIPCSQSVLREVFG